MIEAKVENLGVDPNNGNVIVLLRAETGALLPIWIGPIEAQHIAVALGGDKSPRPLTPDLMLSVLELVGAKLLRVEIVELREGTFYAQLVINYQNMDYELDSRSSDAISLALRAAVPIMVAEDVLEKGSVAENQGQSNSGIPQA
jgi:hypothetical protein